MRRAVAAVLMSSWVLAIPGADTGPQQLAQQPVPIRPIPAKVEPEKPPEIEPIYSMRQKVQWGIDHLISLKKQGLSDYDVSQVRILDASAIPAKWRSDWLRVLDFTFNSSTLEPEVSHFQAVPNSHGLLWFFFLDQFGLDRGTWERVSGREPFYVEPLVLPDQAAAVRSLLGTRQLPRLNVQLIVRADWLFRDLSDLTRSNTYTDFLFAPYNKGSGKIPRNLDDWDDVFGAKAVNDFLRRSGFDSRQGAVVEDGTSIVASQNRLIIQTAIPTRLNGKKSQTLDVLQTAGNGDFTETRNRNFQFDFSELFYTLPNGGRAAALANNKGKLLAKADSDIAVNRLAAGQHARFTVYAPGSCVLCHPSGVNIPHNALADLRASGVKINFLRKQDAIADSAFFFSDLEKQMKNDQGLYADFVARTSGFAPAENSKQYGLFTAWYDQKLDAAQAARELGVDRDVLLELLVDGFRKASAPGISLASPKARLHQLATGSTIPRSVWEFSAYNEIGLLLRAAGK